MERGGAFVEAGAVTWHDRAWIRHYETSECARELSL